MDVSEPTVCMDAPPARPAPTYPEGGSSGSGSRANAVNTDEPDSKNVKCTESRGSEMQGEDVEELEVEVRAHTTYRVEDVAGDAALAAPAQMQTAEKSISLFYPARQKCPRLKSHSGDDEIMELCVLSNELNAFETTAILNPSRFVSHAPRLGLREGFSVDLTAARANGTVWDFSIEDGRTELRRFAKPRAARASCWKSAKCRNPAR